MKSEESLIAGNTYKKYHTRNPIAKYLMANFLRTLSGTLRRLSFDSLLEMGCGEGYLLKSLEAQLSGVELLASDLSPSIIAKAEEIIPEVPKIVASAYDLPVEDKSWDLVLACEVLEHVDDPKKLLHEAKRIAKKHCVFTVPLEPWWRMANMLRGKYLSHWGNTPGHIQHWNRSLFKREIESVFKIYEYTRIGLWQMAVVDCK